VTVDAAQAAQPSVVAVSSDLAPIANAAVLLDHGLAELRQVSLDVVASGLRAADPGLAVDRLVEVDGQFLRVGGRSFDLDAARSVVLLGAGKASLSIAVALERMLGDRISGGLIVRRAGAPGALSHVEVMDADHPVPSEASLAAGRRLVELASTCGPGDLLITAFTGGSSALACLPPEGVPFEAKASLHSMLLDSGASISEVNTVRKHVSRIKGGRLAACAAGATILNLTLSDVVGDAVDLLCDVMVQDTTEPAAAIGVLERYGLWDEVVPEIRRHLGSSEADSPSLADLDITTCVLVTGSTVVEGMAERVRTIGWTPVVLGSALEGDAGGLGRFLGTLAAESSARGRPFAPGAVLVAAGGEATVAIGRRTGGAIGSGGPNQEVALAFAKAVGGDHAQIAGVFLDSDGSDGGTEAAGACVDSTTVQRATMLGVDVDAALARHDSTAVLEQLGDVVTTGSTGTNISDLLVVAIGAAIDAPVQDRATASVGRS
jgi:glycerate 2-kinase